VTPSRVRRMLAVELTGTGVQAGYLFREYGEGDDAWKLVKTRPICRVLGPDQ